MPPRWLLAIIASARFVLRVGQPLHTWYEHWKVRDAEVKQEHKRMEILKKALVLLASVLLALLLIAGVVKALVTMRILSLHTAFNVAGKELPVDENGATNILLLGKGDDSHEGTDLTDSMMVLSIDAKKTQSVVLLSIPRDLFVVTPETRGRVNELYRDARIMLRRKGVDSKQTASGALKYVEQELGKQLGIQIHKTVMVNFSGFVQLVDAMGGVDIVVPEDLIDPEYPNATEDGYITFMLKAGPQHLDGETALKYARSRHSTSDFSRSARQQQLLHALGEKAKEQGWFSNPGKILTLWQIAAKNTETSMSLGELLGLADMASEVNRDNIISVQLNNATGYEGLPPQPGGFLYNPPRDQFDGASVLLPVSIPQFPVTYKQVQALTHLLMTSREIELQHPQIWVWNASGKTGLADKLSDELTRFNFPVEKSENSPDGKRDLSVIFARTEADLPVAEFFGRLLLLPVQVVPQEQLTTDKQWSQITIVLGKDYAFMPMQTLLHY